MLAAFLERFPSFAPLRVRAFRFQFSAQTISMTGSSLSPVALSVGGLSLGLSTVGLGLVLAAYAVPQVAFLLIAGVVADKVPRNTVMQVADATRAVSQTLVGVLLLCGHPWVPVLIVLQAITGTAAAFFQPASIGLTAYTVDRDYLQSANALLALTRSLSGSLGPLCAGLLILGPGAGWALIFDGATFAASSMMLLSVKIDKPVPRDLQVGFAAQLSEGFKEVRSRSWVWSSILTFGVCNLVSSGLTVLGPASMVGRQHDGAVYWSVVVALIGTGQIVGNLAALRLRPSRPMLVARFVELGQVPLIICVAFSLPFASLAIAGIVAGAAMAFPDALWFTALQGQLPRHAISRVSSYDWLGSLALRPIGLALAGALGTVCGVRGTLLAGGALVSLTCVLGGLSPSIRQVQANNSKEL